jgi:hypothetical protein
MSIVTRSPDFMYYVIEPGDATRYQLIIGSVGRESVVASLSPGGTLFSLPVSICDSMARMILVGVTPHNTPHIMYIRGKGYRNHTAFVLGVLMAYYSQEGYIGEDIVEAIGKWYHGDKEILPAIFKEFFSEEVYRVE